MKIYTAWQTPKLESRIAMPAHASASTRARTLTCGTAAVVAGDGMGADGARLDAVRIKGVFPGSPAWSPPLS